MADDWVVNGICVEIKKSQPDSNLSKVLITLWSFVKLQLFLMFFYLWRIPAKRSRDLLFQGILSKISKLIKNNLSYTILKLMISIFRKSKQNLWKVYIAYAIWGWITLRPSIIFYLFMLNESWRNLFIFKGITIFI